MGAVCETLPDGRDYLVEDYEIEISFGWSHTVPKGYITDGASIPRFAWFVVGPPMRGKYREPALVHDHMCDIARIKRDYSRRLLADAVFFMLLERFGVPYWKRLILYLAVRFWGRYTY